MDGLEREDEHLVEARPRMVTVVGLLVALALLFSWIIAYGLTGALRSAELLAPLAAGTDSRPRWMLIAFVSLLGGFMLLSGLFRWLSVRQLRRIDAMAEAEE